MRGITLMTAAMALFAFEDAFLKLAAADLPAGEVLFITGIGGTLVFAMMTLLRGDRLFSRHLLHPAFLARNAGEMVASIAYLLGLAALPLATVAAVLQSLPLVVTMGAALFLGEQVGWRRWLAIAVGFVGVMMIIRPGLDGFQPASLWIVLSVLGVAIRDLATRHIPAGASTNQISAWALFSIALLGGVMMAVTGDAVAPDTDGIWFLVGIFVFGNAGYWAITSATRHGEISVIAPFRYARLLFSLILAVLIFSERPDVTTYAGATLIIGSGLYAFARERARAKAKRRAHQEAEMLAKTLTAG
ncbi:MAG: EamA family transporter [Cereibacter sphaeroides]|uniref:EamA family transporter n=1 Tax=Cereibacter sphaeroides TaxID=1063 RepID=A0A2W5SFW8_CERSP|nr:MAG: EamA family transporter [Cereibacter sphaeroides]